MQCSFCYPPMHFLLSKFPCLNCLFHFHTFVLLPASCPVNLCFHCFNSLISILIICFRHLNSNYWFFNDPMNFKFPWHLIIIFHFNFLASSFKMYIYFLILLFSSHTSFLVHPIDFIHPLISLIFNKEPSQMVLCQMLTIFTFGIFKIHHLHLNPP